MKTPSQLAALSALSLLASTTIAQAEGWYTSVYGGANFSDVISTPFVNDDQPGGLIGGTVGKYINPELRLEADLSFRQNTGTVAGFLDYDHDTVALMATVVYEPALNLGRWHPYVQGSLGFAQTRATFTDVALLRLEASGVAYGAGAGVDVDIATGIKLGVFYQHFQGPSIEVIGTELSDGQNDAVGAKITFAL